MTRDVMTARLYGGEEGWTLYPKGTVCRTNKHLPIKPGIDIGEIIQGAWLLFVLWCIVYVVML